MYRTMIYIPLLFACSSPESTKNMDSSNPIPLDSGIDENTEVDDSQEYFGTIPSTPLAVPDFSAQNYDEELRDKEQSYRTAHRSVVFSSSRNLWLNG